MTKAGPGTIAEAAIKGLPVMLSTYLPGQEAGNVDFVKEAGFGDYSPEPEVKGSWSATAVFLRPAHPTLPYPNLTTR